MALVPSANNDAYAAAQKAVYDEIPKVIEASRNASVSIRATALLEAAQAFRAVTGGPQ